MYHLSISAVSVYKRESHFSSIRLLLLLSGSSILQFNSSSLIVREDEELAIRNGQQLFIALTADDLSASALLNMAQKCVMPVRLHTNLSSKEFCLNGSKVMSYPQSIVGEDDELTVGSFYTALKAQIHPHNICNWKTVAICSIHEWNFPPNYQAAKWYMVIQVSVGHFEKCLVLSQISKSICKALTYTHRTNLINIMQGLMIFWSHWLPTDLLMALRKFTLFEPIMPALLATNVLNHLDLLFNYFRSHFAVHFFCSKRKQDTCKIK